MGASGTPVFQYLAVTDAGQTLTFAQLVSGVLIYNSGPSTVYYANGAVAPTPSIGNGRNSILPGEYAPLNGVSVYQLTFICATGGMATIQVMSIPQGAVGYADAPAYADIDISAWGAVAYTNGVAVVSGPKTVSVPLSGYGELVLDMVNTSAADVLAVQQGATDDAGSLVLQIQVELDNSTVFTTIFNLQQVVTGAGGCGGGGVGATFKSAKINDMAALKALGSTITKIRASGLLTKASGSGVMTGAADFTNMRVRLIPGVQGVSA